MEISQVWFYRYIDGNIKMKKNDGYWLKKLEICNEILRYAKTNIVSLIAHYFITKILYNKFEYINMLYITIFIVL